MWFTQASYKIVMDPTQGTLHSKAETSDKLQEIISTNSDLYNPQMSNFSRIICWNIKKNYIYNNYES